LENATVQADDKILAGVTAVLQRYNPAGHAIGPSTDLAADLNVDSVAAMDLIMEIEDRFEIDIPINLVSDMTTVADLVAVVERQIKAREA
jgi:acyl carrier protein